MTSAFEARAQAMLAQHVPDIASALNAAISPNWRTLASSRGYAPLQEFLTAVPASGWGFRFEGEAPTFKHPVLQQLPEAAKQALMVLQPWRKGPWQFADVRIDAEWRSDWKWHRIRSLLPDLEGQTVFDIGCNNGYYGQQLLEAGARAVIGLDPQPMYVAQALCAEMLMPQRPIVTLPGGLEDLVHCRGSASLLLLMGILYHRTDPLETLRLCAQSLARGGKLLIETIVIAGDETTALFIPQRYAGAKGFYWLPTRACLHAWLRRANLRVLEETGVAPTTQDEQRSTAWRAGDSLQEGLDPRDSSLTIEGHPAPSRIALVCTRG